MRVEFPDCVVFWEPENRRVVTRFWDGTEAYGCPHDTPEYRQHAAEKSTGDVDLYAWQHDLAHCIVAMTKIDQDEGISKVLFNLAHGARTDTPECEAEELAAQEFQKRFFLR
jgi:hypothetical protein